MEIKRLEPGKRMSEAVVYNHVAYLAGQIPEDTSKGPADQTRQVLAAIDSVLAKLGSDKSKLLSATVYLSNIGNFAAMNEAWDAWVSPGNPPARATVEARLASPDILVEIVVTAAVRSPGSNRRGDCGPNLWSDLSAGIVVVAAAWGNPRAETFLRSSRDGGRR